MQTTAPAVDPAEVAAASATAVAAASAVSPEARREARRQRHLAEAAKMHQGAAERGLATAQFNLATCYMEGTGIEEDKAKAVENYEKAAAQGHWVVSASATCSTPQPSHVPVVARLCCHIPRRRYGPRRAAEQGPAALRAPPAQTYHLQRTVAVCGCCLWQTVVRCDMLYRPAAPRGCCLCNSPIAGCWSCFVCCAGSPIDRYRPNMRSAAAT